MSVSDKLKFLSEKTSSVSSMPDSPYTNAATDLYASQIEKIVLNKLMYQKRQSCMNPTRKRLMILCGSGLWGTQENRSLELYRTAYRSLGNNPDDGQMKPIGQFPAAYRNQLKKYINCKRPAKVR